MFHQLWMNVLLKHLKIPRALKINGGLLLFAQVNLFWHKKTKMFHFSNNFHCLCWKSFSKEHRYTLWCRQRDFFVLCYQYNPSILSTVTHIYIVSVKARIDEHGRHRKNFVVKSNSVFVRDPFTVIPHSRLSSWSPLIASGKGEV